MKKLIDLNAYPVRSTLKFFLQPRISKAAEEQQERTRKKAEVFV